MTIVRNHWIPPFALVVGAALNAASWAIVFAYALAPSQGLELAWIHTFALGSLTTISLAVLIHVVPGFTDLRWRFERLARALTSILPIVAIGLIASFVAWWSAGIALFAAFVAATVVLYVAVALVTLARPAADPADRAVARALGFVLTALGATATVGALMALALVDGDAAALRLAPIHVALGLVGWLTLLVVGVSVRTLRPMLGAPSRFPVLHIVASSLLAGGLLATILAIALDPAFVRAALGICALGTIPYIVDVADRIRRGAIPHWAPRAFVASSLVWMLVAAVAATLGFDRVAVVAALAGWLGQMLYAHLHHIGIRVIATAVLGEDDETRPWELLDARTSATTWASAQLGVLALLLALSLQGVPGLFLAAAMLGAMGSVTFGLNATRAIRRARTIAASGAGSIDLSRSTR